MGGSVTIDALATRVRAAEARAGSTRVVAIDGPSGAGKTVLAARLAKALGGAPVVHLDDLYPGWDGLAAAPALLSDWVLQPLSRGEPARYRRYDWAGEEYAEWHDVPAAPVLVVEGCGAGARACAPYLALLVWVDAPAEVRRRRGLARDPGYEPHWERWAAQEQVMWAVDGTRERADVCLDGGPARP
ncbi:MAG TPA: uridine kinase [Actinomycetes bacterium]|nr:uridine kinase [Actinomycetes bacterium]